MILIAAVDDNWGLGKDNKLLYSLPEDMAFFRKQTLGKTVVMGRKTLESFKDAKPLPKRKNIVLSRSAHESKYLNLEFVSDINNIDYKNDNIFLIGGANIYNQYYSLCDYAYITKIHKTDIEPDVYLHNFDNDPDWHLERVVESGISQENTHYEILLYKKGV